MSPDPREMDDAALASELVELLRLIRASRWTFVTLAVGRPAPVAVHRRQHALQDEQFRRRVAAVFGGL